MTKASDYQRLIDDRKLPAESSSDIIEMIELLVSERILLRTNSKMEVAKDKQYDFVAKVICILFDPFKSENYTGEIQRVRLKFYGISENGNLRSLFRRSIGQRLLTEDDDRAIYSLVDQFGIKEIFTV